MGLDWCLKYKVNDGEEAEAKRLQKLLDKIDNSGEGGLEEYNKVEAELRKHVTMPEDSLGAPRIGVDEAATEWLRKLHKENKVEATFEEFLEEHFGEPVVDLVYDKSTVTGIMAGATSFRGKVVGYSEHVPEDLQEEAYKDHDAKQALDYGKRLMKAVCDSVRGKWLPCRELTDEQIAQACANLHKRAMEFSKANPKGDFEATLKAHEIGLIEARQAVNAAEWLIFWGGKSFGFHAWY